MIGTRLGNYVLTRELGSGGMGTVYLGENFKIGRKVAIKVLSEHVVGSAQHLSRFTSEAIALNRIEHPNVIQMFDFGETEDGTHYFVMEYLEGQTLSGLLRERTIFTAEAAWPFIRQICGALDSAHQLGIIHRDLKPSNIYVADRTPPAVKVLDFGIAKLLWGRPSGASDLTHTGLMLGSPVAMSPEQAAGRPDSVGVESDVYSLGIIAFWMLCGRPPFVESKPMLLVARHLEEQPPRLEELVPTIHPAISELIHDCLTKEPSDRPASIRDVAQRFGEAIGAPNLPDKDPSAFMTQYRSTGNAHGGGSANQYDSGTASIAESTQSRALESYRTSQFDTTQSVVGEAPAKRNVAEESRSTTTLGASMGEVVPGLPKRSQSRSNSIPIAMALCAGLVAAAVPFYYAGSGRDKLEGSYTKGTTAGSTTNMTSPTERQTVPGSSSTKKTMPSLPSASLGHEATSTRPPKTATTRYRILTVTSDTMDLMCAVRANGVLLKRQKIPCSYRIDDGNFVVLTVSRQGYRSLHRTFENLAANRHVEAYAHAKTRRILAKLPSRIHRPTKRRALKSAETAGQDTTPLGDRPPSF